MKPKTIFNLALLTFVVCVFAFPSGRRALAIGYMHAERTRFALFPPQPGQIVYFPFQGLMTRIGAMPLRYEIEPGVSLLLDPQDIIGRSILYAEWEPQVLDAVRRPLREGAVFLDVGAHIGYYSLRAAARVGPSGRVIAFEPNPDTLMKLRENISHSRAGASVTVLPIACADRDQQLTLYAGPASNIGVASFSRENAVFFTGSEPKAYQVHARPIDDVANDLGLTRVDVIKIDVEGAETVVLQGALNTVRRFRPVVITEMVPRQLESLNSSVEQLTSVFQSVGYRKSREIDETNWEWTPVPESSRLSGTPR